MAQPPERLLLIGGWGHHYLQAVAHRAGEVAVAGDGFDDMARLRADSIEGARWFDEAGEALATFEPDVVSIGGVYGRNAELLPAVQTSGAGVVCDKPIAVSTGQLEAAEAAGGVVLTEMPLRCEAGFRTARAAVVSGAIGEPVLATAQKSYKFGSMRPEWYSDRALYTGTVLWISTHGLDLIRYVTGLEATAVGGHGGNVSRTEYGSMEDHVVSVLALDNGGTGVAHADYLRPPGAETHGDDRIRVAGSDGVIEVRDGRCLLIDGASGSTDITDESLEVDVAETLLDALAGDDAIYSTAESLATARLALEARDAITS